MGPDGHNSDESPPSPYYNCGVCGDRILSNDSHHCWTFEKIQVQEQFADTGDKYADFTGSEDVVARLKKPPQYPDYS